MNARSLAASPGVQFVLQTGCPGNELANLRVCNEHGIEALNDSIQVLIRTGSDGIGVLPNFPNQEDQCHEHGDATQDLCDGCPFGQGSILHAHLLLIDALNPV